MKYTTSEMSQQFPEKRRKSWREGQIWGLQFRREVKIIYEDGLAQIRQTACSVGYQVWYGKKFVTFTTDLEAAKKMLKGQSLKRIQRLYGG